VTILPAAPLVTFSRPGAAKATVTRSVAASVVRVSVRVQRAAALTLTVRNPRTGLKLRMQPGSRVAATILKRPAAAVTASISGARVCVVEAALARGELVRGRDYQLLLDAIAKSGERSETKISFRA
jgi:hypothetical protein